MFSLLCILVLSLPICTWTAAVAMNLTVEEETEAYLKHYGYLNAQSRTFSLGSYDTALKKMQKMAGIPETGKLDEATKKILVAPRCGFTDKADSGKFVFGGSRWRKHALTYRLENFSNELGEAATRRIIARAFKYWSDVTPLTFTEIKSRGDLNVKFQAGRHYNTWKYCLSNFDGKGKVLAHAFHPEDGRVHFDEDEDFTDGTYKGTNLLWVATHELGHALGLKHSPVRAALMYPYYTGYQKNFFLPAQDIRDIQEVYGSGGGGSTKVNGNWGSWSSYTSCSAACGGGTASRGRACNNPSPSGGGSTCSGSATQTANCNQESCKGGSSCKDLDTDCSKFPQSYCASTHQYYNWMKQNCPKHCGICGGGSGESKECKDLDTDCPKYPKTTYCVSSHASYSWMAANCPKHCGVCTGGGDASKTWYGPFTSIWGDDQCTSAGTTRSGLDRNGCLNACQQIASCNAVNFSASFCVFRACAWPVPDPKSQGAGYTGFRLQSAGGSVCKDTNASCPGWAGVGECQKNPGWMNPNCAKSCKQC